MGRIYCGRCHALCCWGCDGCPKCERSTGKIGRGDYCVRCAAKAVTAGLQWSPYHQNYVPPEDARQSSLPGVK